MGKDEIPALSLSFKSDVPRIPGELLDGEVQLYFPTLLSDDIEEVHIKLRGAIITMVVISTGNSAITQIQRVELVRETVSLWYKGTGSAYPPPDSNTLAVPFRFQLPADLPPSCSYGGSPVGWEGTVRYALEVVGVRPRLHLNRRIRVAFPLLPPSAQGADLRSAIIAGGWQGGWRRLQNENNIRKGIWGDYSHVKATLDTPDLEVYPTRTPIPFTLIIATITKPMKIDDTKQGEPIFPTPPVHLNNPKELNFELSRAICIESYGVKQTHNQVAAKGVGGIGDPDLQNYANILIEPLDKVWIPSVDSKDEKKSKGQWKQGVTIRSSFILEQVPTFETKTLKLNYKAKFKIGFPGVGNDLKLQFPITVVSCMPPLGAQAWDGQPSELDLPPGYFVGAESWFGDDKDEK